jgi:hypothetical protein
LGRGEEVINYKHLYLLYTINAKTGNQLLMGVSTLATDAMEWEDSIPLNMPKAVKVELNALNTDFENGVDTR